MASIRSMHFPYTRRLVTTSILIGLVSILSFGIANALDMNSTIVTKSDIDKLVSYFGTNNAEYDINKDGKITVVDLSIGLRKLQNSPSQQPGITTNDKMYPNTTSGVYRLAYGSEASTKRNSLSATDLALIKKIADQPRATWLGYSTDTTILPRVLQESATSNTVPVIVVYCIPDRDRGQYAAAGGGCATLDDYKAKINYYKSQIGNRKAVIVLEPDGLGQGIAEDIRKQSMQYATAELGKLTNAKTYIDATNSGWYGADWKSNGEAQMAQMLQTVGIANVTGFVTNVSNFQTTQSEINYANRLLVELGKLSPNLAKKRYIIDTSRNGNGPRPAPKTATELAERKSYDVTDSSGNVKNGGEYGWCNPPNRALGLRPTFDVSIYPELLDKGNLDALTWVKEPGGIDGDCAWKAVAQGILPPERKATKDIVNFWIYDGLNLARNAKW